MTLNELARECHAMAVEHGWYERSRGLPEFLVLMHSEISEALEEWRGGALPAAIIEGSEGLYDGFQYVRKPCGIPIELADLIIRTLDMCGYYGIDIDAAVAEKLAYNALHPMRHGGKRA